jgi:hypothetical protein
MIFKQWYNYFIAFKNILAFYDNIYNYFTNSYIWTDRTIV